MKHLATRVALVCCSGFFIGACSSATKNADADLDSQVKAQRPANTAPEIANRAAETFANAPGLTADQKAKLTTIYQKVYRDAGEIRKEIGQSKSLMFQLVSTTDYKSADVQRLKEKIVTLDQKRLQIMFKALEDVQGVVGYGKEKMELYRHLRDYEFPKEPSVLSGL